MQALTKLIKTKREDLGLTHLEFADLIGLKNNGENEGGSGGEE